MNPDADDLRVNIWMPTMIDDVLAETAALTLYEIGVYELLRLHYWRRDGSLPAELPKIVQLCKLAKRDVVKRILNEFFFIGEDGTYHHADLDKALALAKENRLAARSRGKAGAEKRWDNARAKLQQSSSIAQAAPARFASNGRVQPEQCPLPSSASQSSSAAASPSRAQ